MTDMNNNKNNEKDIKNYKEGVANIKQIPVVTMDTISLAHKIYKKFGDNAEAINAVSNLIDMIYVKDNALVIDGTIIDELITVGNNSEQNECCENCKSCVENTEFVSLFDYPDVNELNKAIDDFEKLFEDRPYLVMNSDTLDIFEKCTRKFTCLDVEHDDVDCIKYDDCEGCPFESNEEGTVDVNYDRESDTIASYYFHNEDEYTIVIDNDLAFGVVKIR